jgi:hypothetical protein
VWNGPAISGCPGVAAPRKLLSSPPISEASERTPESAVDYVADQAETAGIDYVCTQVAFGDITFAEAARTVGLMAAEVMPAFARVPA